MGFRRASLIGLIVPLTALAQDPVILVNSQGLAQHDMSIRGSSYSGAGISINGLNLKVPYSAHFNSELPIPEFLFSDPVAQYGLGNASGHLIGTVAYTARPQQQNGQAGASIGTKEHYAANISAFAFGTGGFLDWEKARQIDYDDNDLDRYAGGAHIQYFADDWQIDLIGAGQRKEFGAQGYYGQSSAVYAEQETEDALLFLFVKTLQIIISQRHPPRRVTHLLHYPPPFDDLRMAPGWGVGRVALFQA